MYIYLIDDDGNFITDENGNNIILAYYNVTMVFPGLGQINAANDAFGSFENHHSSPWSIQADVNNVVAGGTPQYTVMVSNVSLLEADMKPYRPETSNVALADIVADAMLAFRYVGIKYTANGATGTLTFYINQTALRTVLA